MKWTCWRHVIVIVKLLVIFDNDLLGTKQNQFFNIYIVFLDVINIGW